MQNSPNNFYETEENINEKLKLKLEKIKTFFLNAKNTYWIDFVLSRELDNIDFEKVKIILIWDNPWEKELKNNEFFSSEWTAWKMARDLFNWVYSQESFTKEVLVLNKTLFHTNRTHQLKDSKWVVLLKESQILMADFLFDFLKEKKVPVIVVWFAQMEWFFKPFFDIFKKKWEELKLLDSIFVSPHFSMSKIFCKHKNEHWNELIDLFLLKYPYLETDKWNISSKAFYASWNREIFKDFLEMVVLKQGLMDY